MLLITRKQLSQKEMRRSCEKNDKVKKRPLGRVSSLVLSRGLDLRPFNHGRLCMVPCEITLSKLCCSSSIVTSMWYVLVQTLVKLLNKLQYDENIVVYTAKHRNIEQQSESWTSQWYLEMPSSLKWPVQILRLLSNNPLFAHYLFNIHTRTSFPCFSPFLVHLLATPPWGTSEVNYSKVQEVSPVPLQRSKQTWAQGRCSGYECNAHRGIRPDSNFQI